MSIQRSVRQNQFQILFSGFLSRRFNLRWKLPGQLKILTLCNKEFHENRVDAWNRIQYHRIGTSADKISDFGFGLSDNPIDGGINFGVPELYPTGLEIRLGGFHRFDGRLILGDCPIQIALAHRILPCKGFDPVQIAFGFCQHGFYFRNSAHFCRNIGLKRLAFQSIKKSAFFDPRSFFKMNPFQETLHPCPDGNILETIYLTDKFLIDGNVFWLCNDNGNFGRGRLRLLLFFLTARKKQQK